MLGVEKPSQSWEGFALTSLACSVGRNPDSPPPLPVSGRITPDICVGYRACLIYGSCVCHTPTEQPEYTPYLPDVSAELGANDAVAGTSPRVACPVAAAERRARDAPLSP